MDAELENIKIQQPRVNPEFFSLMIRLLKCFFNGFLAIKLTWIPGLLFLRFLTLKSRIVRTVKGALNQINS